MRVITAYAGVRSSRYGLDLVTLSKGLNMVSMKKK